MSASLTGCVSSLHASTTTLQSSISILDSGVADFPRLSKVLQTTRHFHLLPESSLSAAQASLLSTITPELSALLARAEAHVQKMARREEGLVARAELLQGRLGGGGGSSSGGNNANSGARSGSGSGSGEKAGREALRLKQMRQRKERLSFAVERLSLQAQQRERQLRMSVAGR